MNRKERQKTPCTSAADKEEAERIQRALKTLRDDEQIVMKLRYGDDKSVNEIAGQMGRSENAVWKLLRRATVRLRSIVGG